MTIYTEVLGPVHLDHYLQQTCIVLNLHIMSSRASINAQPTGEWQHVH